MMKKMANLKDLKMRACMVFVMMLERATSQFVSIDYVFYLLMLEWLEVLLLMLPHAFLYFIFLSK
jgi:hypothetical protein